MKKRRDTRDMIVAYVPVLHEGYVRFFRKHRKARKLLIFGKDITKEFKQLGKDLRALDPKSMKKAIGALGIFENIIVIDTEDFRKLEKTENRLIMPDEDVMRELCQKYLPKRKIIFDSIFLRWDKHKSFIGKPVQVDQTISRSEFDLAIIGKLKAEAKKSPDWWRNIGAAIVKDGQIILMTHNHAVPREQMPYVEGDPRADFSKGVNIELSTSFHAEARLIAESASKGINLTGAEMYATTFPCPPCAKLIAYSGIKKLYYTDGYGVLDGERILKSRGVKIVFVDQKHK